MNIAMLGPSDMVHLRRIVTSLSHLGHRVHVISHKSESIPGATFEHFEVPGPSLKYPHRWRRRWEKSICDVFRRFDVVCVHFLADWGITQKAVSLGRLVVKPYGSDIVTPPGMTANSETMSLNQSLLRHAHAVTCASPYFAKCVADYANLDPDKIAVIPDGVDLRMFHPQNRRSHDGVVVGFHKGFHAVYDPKMMVRAASIVADARPAVRFEFVGDGPMREECQDLALSIGAGRCIEWIDRLSPEALVDRMAYWDLVAVSSVHETLCVAAIEAGAMGIPVVATRAGGLCETVRDGETGVLVETGDAEAMGAAIVTLSDDGATRWAMGRGGRKWVEERYDWADSVARWDRLLHEVAGGSCSGSGKFEGGRGQEVASTIG